MSLRERDRGVDLRLGGRFDAVGGVEAAGRSNVATSSVIARR